MKLLLEDGTTFMAHFHYTPYQPYQPEKMSAPSQPAGARVTYATVHLGPCHNQTRPCDTESSVGSAVCSVNDQFCRAIDRKVALTRALASYPRAIRTQFWEAYGKGRRWK